MAVATGHLLLAVPLLAITGFHDLLDGPVAKAAGTASVRGAFFDSVTDRVADIVVMGGVAWYLVSVHEGHLVLLPLAIVGVSSLVSYERAKAEALGLAAKGGLMERAERMILLGVGFLASWLLVPVLWVLLALTTATAVGRFVRVWRAAEGPARSAAECGVVPGRRGCGGHRRRRRRPGRAGPLAPGPGRVALAGLAGGRGPAEHGRPGRRAGGTLAGPAPRGAGQPDRAGPPGPAAA